MNFNSFIEKNHDTINEYRAGRNIEDFCVKVERKKEDENYELRLKYEKMKETFKNFRELWTEDEICIVYDDLKDLSKKEIKRTVYLTAMKLERTRKAVLWMFLHIFSEKQNLHRGKEVIKFRQKINLA